MDTSQAPANNADIAVSDEQQAADEPAETSGEGAEIVTAEENHEALEETNNKWPGWPGYTVFRLLVPVLKVGGVIGRKGDIIKKLVEETRARVRVLDAPITSPDRIVLISAKEEPEAALPPAMDATIRVFKRVNGLPENDGDEATGAAFCSTRLLVASTQAISLIGKQGSLIKSIQEMSGASVRVFSNADVPSYYASSDERVVEIQGEAVKVHKALEAVVGHLRKFLVDHSILPLFEKSHNAPATQERQVETSMLKRDPLFLEHESQIESRIESSRLQHGIGNRSSIIGLSGGHLVTQIAQTMQIPLAYAEDIIGIQGVNIDYIRRTSGAILTVQESRGLPDEITVEIKGSSAQVQIAQQLIQEFISGHREPHPRSYESYSRLGCDGNTYAAGGYNSSFRL